MDLYNVIVSDLAELDLDIFLDFLINVKLSRQSAESVYQDYVETLEMLKLVAGSLKLDYDPDFAALGYRRIGFLHHSYFMSYRIENNTAIVDRIYHEAQDYSSDKAWI